MAERNVVMQGKKVYDLAQRNSIAEVAERAKVTKRNGAVKSTPGSASNRQRDQSDKQ